MTQKNLFEGKEVCSLEIVLLGDQIGSTGYYYTVTIAIPNLHIPSETFGEEQEQVSYTIPFTEQTVLKVAGSDYCSVTVRTSEDATKLLVAA